MVVTLMRRQPRRAALLFVAAIMGVALLATAGSMRPAHAVSNGSAYDVATVVDTNPDPNIVETTIVADEATVDIGNGVMANVQTFNGTDPRPGVPAQGRRHGDRPLREPPRRRRPASTGTASSSPTRATARRSRRTRCRRAGSSSTSSRSRGPGSSGTTRTTTRRRTRCSRACTARSSSATPTRRRCRASGVLPPASQTTDARAQRHDGLQGARHERRGHLRPDAAARERRQRWFRSPAQLRSSLCETAADRRRRESARAVRRRRRPEHPEGEAQQGGSTRDRPCSRTA